MNDLAYMVINVIKQRHNILCIGDVNNANAYSNINNAVLYHLFHCLKNKKTLKGNYFIIPTEFLDSDILVLERSVSIEKIDFKIIFVKSSSLHNVTLLYIEDFVEKFGPYEKTDYSKEDYDKYLPFREKYQNLIQNVGLYKSTFFSEEPFAERSIINFLEEFMSFNTEKGISTSTLLYYGNKRHGYNDEDTSEVAAKEAKKKIESVLHFSVNILDINSKSGTEILKKSLFSNDYSFILHKIDEIRKNVEDEIDKVKNSMLFDFVYKAKVGTALNGKNNAEDLVLGFLTSYFPVLSDFLSDEILKDIPYKIRTYNLQSLKQIEKFNNEFPRFLSNYLIEKTKIYFK